MDFSSLTISLETSLTPEISLVGGKAASLIRLKQAGFSVPDGCVLASEFFRPWTEKLKSSPEWKSVRTALTSTDATALRAVCEAAKRSVASFIFPVEQRAALARIAATMTGRPLAVRSSSPEEDLNTASFAGLYKTVLNVAASGLEDAVRSCFESCLDERVLLYKREKGFDIEPPTLAVVIQAQLPSEISGVAFSLNPLTNDFDQVVINAAWGQGEALVSGAIDPDRFVIDKFTRAILERRAGSKGGDRPEELCLGDQQLCVLTETIKAVEDLYGFPVDVEWAFVSSRLHLLQARPITAFVPLPPEMLTAPGEPRVLYADVALSKGFTIDAPITPMSNDILLRAIQLACEALVGNKNALPQLKSGLFALAGARMYVNWSNVLHLVDTKHPQRLIAQTRVSDAMLADILETQDLEMYKVVDPPPSLRALPLLWTMLKILWGMRGFLLGVVAQLVRRRTFPERYRAEVLRFERAMAEQPRDDLSLGEFVRHCYAKTISVAKSATAPALILFFYFGTERLSKLIDPSSSAERALVDAIKRGYGDDLVIEMGTTMYRLSTLIPQTAFADLGTLVDKLKRRELPESFLSLWDEFIRRFGCRGPMEMEIANPKYGDDPSLALQQIATIAKSAGRFDPREIQQQHIKEREAAYVELRGRLKGRKRRQLERSYRNIVEFGGTRDTPKHHLTMINSLIRRRLLAEADRLVAAGRLQHRDQIFFLTLEDLEEAERNAQLDLQARLDERSLWYRKTKATVKHFPQVIDSRGRIVRPIKPAVEGELSGTAVSPGVASGPVKVLADPFEKEVMPGDIVVAYTTDPGWTPLFINAAAVVLEVGGELQHGALVAREYGKPCVVGISRLTTLLRDGEVVEVDGNAGVVRMLERRGHASCSV